METNEGHPDRPGILRGIARAASLNLRIARMLRPHSRGEGGRFALATLLSVLFLAFRLAQPWPLKWIIDGLGGAPTPWAVSLAALSVAYVLIAGMAALVEYVQRRLVAGLANRIVSRFRGSLFSHLLGLPLAYQERKGAGELLTRVVWDTARLRRGVSGILLRMYQNTLLFLATVGVLLWISPLLAGSVLACGLIAFATMTRTHRRILDAARYSRRREGRLASVVEEDLRGARDLQTYGSTGDRRFDAANEKSLKGEQKLVALEAGLLFGVEILLAASVCAVLWQGTRAVSLGALTSGDLILFVHYTLALYRPFIQFARQASQAGRTAACAERLMKIAGRRAAVSDGPAVAPAFSGEIAFENLRVKASQRARGGRFWLLDDVSFRIAPGARVAVMGPNGAGKSTLLKHLVRLQDPESGRILIDGRDVREFTLDSFRARFSVVHQDAALFGLSVRENVALGKPGATDAEIYDALERSGAAELVRRLPKGLDTAVRGARIFSSGERQRLALARALLRDGRIWLLDEPTAALDKAPEAERALLAALQNKTVLWITHDLATAMRMDKILLLIEGKLSFFGSPEELKGFLSKEGTNVLLDESRENG